MVGLPKSIIKKYGVSKEAWRVYRGEKRTQHRRTSKGGFVRKRTHRRGGGFGGMGGGFMRHGLAPTMGKGIIALGVSAGIGYIAGKFVNPFLPQVIPMQSVVLGLVAGGLPGAVGGFASGTSSNGGYL